MTDRFKFRGRRIDNDALVYGSLLRNEFGWNIVTFESVLVDPDTNSHDLEMILVGIVDGSQEQCTGLKDKNGVLIYEGDIVVARDQYPWFSDDEHNYASIIEWEYGAWYYSMEPISKRVRGSACGGQLCSGGNEDSQLFEVIGNIHENPELLEQR